jgi:hypothetical protein
MSIGRNIINIVKCDRNLQRRVDIRMATYKCIKVEVYQYIHKVTSTLKRTEKQLSLRKIKSIKKLMMRETIK